MLFLLERQELAFENVAFRCRRRLELHLMLIKKVLPLDCFEIHILIHVGLLHQVNRWAFTIEQLRHQVDIEVLEVLRVINRLGKFSVDLLLHLRGFHQFHNGHFIKVLPLFLRLIKLVLQPFEFLKIHRASVAGVVIRIIDNKRFMLGNLR